MAHARHGHQSVVLAAGHRALDVATASLATAARLGAGVRVGTLGARPAETLELYDMEGCPYCRLVREALTTLDLGALVYPCPRGATRWRAVLEERGGRVQVPYLVDRGAGVATYESDEIVRHLFRSYGDGRVPLLLTWRGAAKVTSALASSARPGLGVSALPSRGPDRPLELYSFEASPYCRLVREQLCSLELPYLLHNVGKKSPSRGAFVARSGRMMVPWISDPNTGVEMFESGDIVRYLSRTYGSDERADGCCSV